MIIDYDDELTGSTSQAAPGQAITATAAGTKPKDAGAARDWGAGECCMAFYRVVTAAQGGADFNTLTSLTLAVEGCDTSAGASPVVLVSKSVVLANLTAGATGTIGLLAAGTLKRWARANITVVGSAPSQGKIQVWLGKPEDRPQNKANSF